MNELTLPEESIFLEALEIEGSADLADFLDRACGSDSQLRAGVESLLRASRKSGDLLDVSECIDGPTYVPSGAEKPGAQIGPYRLLEEIGDGGMGVVYLAEQKEPVRRKVALKVIKPGMDSREVIARFDAERQALAIMDHPNISRMLEAGTTTAGRPYFVMDLVKGVPITEFCDRRKFDTRQRLQLFITVCQAVQHAHQKGLIHRDLKPGNVLVEMHDVTPVPKVIDFGVAKALGQELTEQTLHTGFGQMVGTPLYMSPEQAGGSSYDVDTRSDIYSLGVLLYELLTGHTPFARETLRSVGPDEMRRMIREVDPPRPSARISTLQAKALSTVSECRQVEPRKLSQQLRGELDWIVMKALEKDRTLRYGSADALAADLQCYLDDRPVHACPPSAVYRLRKLVYRKRALLIALTVFAVCVPLAAYGVYTLIQQTGTPDGVPSTTLAPIPSARAPGRELPGLVPEPPLIPDVGRWQLMTQRPRGVIRSAMWNRDETLLALTEANHVRIYDLSNLLLLQVFVGHTQPTTSVAWHPDGERLASASEDGTVRLWTKTGVPTHLLEGHTGPVYQVAWRPDGQQLASASADGTVRLWNPEGKLIETLDEAGRHVFGIDWSPDGKQLATVGGDIRPVGADGDVADNSLRIWDADTGKLVRRIQSFVGYSALCVDWRPDGLQLAVGYGHVYRQMHWVAKPLPDSGVRIWNSDGTSGPEVGRDKGSVSTLSWHPDGKQLAFGGRSGFVWIWNSDDQRVANTDIPRTHDLFLLTWSRNGSRLLATCRDSVRECDGKGTAVSLASKIDQSFGFYDGCWSPDGTMVAGEQIGGGTWFATSEGVSLPVPERPAGDIQAWWDIIMPDRRPGGMPAPTLEGEVTADGNTKFAWSKQGWLAAASWHDQSVRIWNDQGKLTATCKGHRGGVESVSWSPDGAQVVSGGGDSVRIWNRDGTAGPLMTGHTDEVYGVAWSPDGQWIASGSTDSTVRLWRPDGTAGPVLRGHEAGVFDVSWSPDSQKLISTSWLDSTLRVWDVASGETEWQALRLDSETTVTVSPLGFLVPGNPDVLDALLLYGVEQRDGTLDLLTPSEFRKRHGTTLLSALAARFNKFTEAHELTRSESELALALTLRADVDIKSRVQIGTLAEQLANALYFERDHWRAEQAIRTAIEIQQEVVNELPDNPLQQDVLSSRWLRLGTYLSAAGRNAEGLEAITASIAILQERIKSEPDNEMLRATLAFHFYKRAQRQPTLEAAMADIDRILEVEPDLTRPPHDFCYFLDDLLEESADPAKKQVREIAAEQQIEIVKAVYLTAAERLRQMHHDRRFADWLSGAPDRFRDPELAVKVARWAQHHIPANLKNDFLRSRAWADFRRGDAQNCIATLDQIDSHGDASEFIRAMAYQSLGKTSEARAAFDRGTEWSKGYLQEGYVIWWKEDNVPGLTPGTVRRLQAEAAAMLDAADKRQLSAVRELPAAASDQ